MLGVNGSWLQPSSPAGRPRLSRSVYSVGVVNTPCSLQESASIVECMGPVHAVGSVSSGGGVAALVATHSGPSIERHHPRLASWRGSPGTPQNVTRLEMNPAISV